MKVVLQDGNKDCGICSLLSIIRFYGGDVSKEAYVGGTYVESGRFTVYSNMNSSGVNSGNIIRDSNGKAVGAKDTAGANTITIGITMYSISSTSSFYHSFPSP